MVKEGDEKEKKRPPGERGPGGAGASAWIWAVVFLVLLAVLLLRVGGPAPPEVSYSRFRQELARGNVERLTASGQRLDAELEEPVAIQDGDEETSSIRTYYPEFGGDELQELVSAEDVELVVRPESDMWWTLVLSLGPFLLLIIFFVAMTRGLSTAGRGLLSMGRSRARLFDQRKEKTTFRDVAGSEEAKHELSEIVDFLRDPKRVVLVGGEMPKGVLLMGPPGTGKTLLARAVAGEADVPFFSISGSDFMEMFVGVGASRVRDMFSEAKKSAPSIVFIDELDSVGRKRGTGVGGGHDEREQTLNQLLSEMDGFEPNVGVVVMAATNRPDVLDPALLRPGRFDRRVTVNLPTSRERKEILEVHARGKPLAPEVDLQGVARSTAGFSGADLRNLLNEAALLVARKGKDAIGQEEIEEARDKVMMGLERKSVSLSREESELLAYHESGHAVVAAKLPRADPIHKVTIVPRSQSMGHTEQIQRVDRYVYERDYLLDRLAVLLGGRASEELFKETATSGAENDLKEATRLARSMVLDWGMGGEELSSIALGGGKEDVFLGRELAQRRDYGDATANEIDRAVRRILSQAYQRARSVLSEEREGVRRLVEALVEREEIPGDEVLSILEESPSGVAAASG